MAYSGVITSLIFVVEALVVLEIVKITLNML